LLLLLLCSLRFPLLLLGLYRLLCLRLFRLASLFLRLAGHPRRCAVSGNGVAPGAACGAAAVGGVPAGCCCWILI
jgi:hypothetical protein